MRISDWSSDVCSSDLYFPYLNRIRKPLQTMVAKIGKLDRSTGGLEGRCIRKDCVRLGQRLKPCCQMNDTAKGGNRNSRWGSRTVANHCLAAGNAHSNSSRLLFPLCSLTTKTVV